MDDQVINGLLYRFTDVGVYRCKNCLRVTMSADCGCPVPEPIYVGETKYGTPVSRDVIEATPPPPA